MKHLVNHYGSPTEQGIGVETALHIKLETIIHDLVQDYPLVEIDYLMRQVITKITTNRRLDESLKEIANGNKIYPSYGRKGNPPQEGLNH